MEPQGTKRIHAKKYGDIVYDFGLFGLWVLFILYFVWGHSILQHMDFCNLV